MSKRKKKPRRHSDSLPARIQRAEALLEEVASRLGEIESRFRDQTGRAREMEAAILSQIAEVRSRSRSGQAHDENAIVLEEGSAVDLEGWERKMDEKYAVLSAKEGEVEKLEKRIKGELEKLLAETKQRDFLLAAREEELRTLKQTLSSRLNELEVRIARPSAGGKPARLVSFLVDIGKKQ